MPQFETILWSPQLQNSLMGSAEVSAPIALWASFFPCQFPHYSLPYSYVSRLLPHKLFSHIRICFSGIHYKAASDNTVHQNCLNCCSKHSPSTQCHLTPIFPSIIEKEVLLSFGLRRQAKNQRNQSQSYLLCFVFSDSVLYPRTPLTHQEKDLFHIKIKYTEEVRPFKGITFLALLKHCL